MSFSLFDLEACSVYQMIFSMHYEVSQKAENYRDYGLHYFRGRNILQIMSFLQYEQYFLPCFNLT